MRMKEGLKECGFTVYGGDNAPYIWLKTPNRLSSWKFFDKLLYEVNIVGTPGVGFGPSGEGYLRLTAFGDREDTLEAMYFLRKAHIGEVQASIWPEDQIELCKQKNIILL